MIDGDVVSETKKERHEVSEKDMNIQSGKFVHKHAQAEYKIIAERNLKPIKS
jgi:hypothetical protein